MINLIANEKLKNLGCKWDGLKWTAPKLAENEADAIKKEFYNDLVIVEVTINKNEKLNGIYWVYSHARTVGGYIVATAKGRDSGATIQNDVAVLKGEFRSGGSMKNYICAHSDDLVLRMHVSKNALTYLDKEVSDGLYTYKIIDSEERTIEDLMTEKQVLLEKLALVEKKILAMRGE